MISLLSRVDPQACREMEDLSFEQTLQAFDQNPAQFDTTPESRKTRSKLRAFFSRRKSDKPPKSPLLPCNEGPGPAQLPSPPTTPEAHPAPQRPGTNRARTYTNRSGPSTNPLSSRQRSTTWDPPPLFQAYSQAILHAVLDVPSLERHASGRVFHHRRQSSDVTYTANGKQSNSRIESFDPQSPGHQRNVSNSGNSNTVPKLFILIGTGYILQYSSSGSPDRLPEKILELGSTSVAYVCDGPFGRPWALRVLHDANEGDSKMQSSRSTWSRLTFRQSEGRRLVKDFLLVFDTPQYLDLWLNAIRREVENLGGADHRVDHEMLQSMDQGPLGPSHLLRFSRSSPILSMDAFSYDTTTTPHISQEYAPSLVPSTHPLLPRKSFGSSVETRVGLESWRGSSISDKESSFTGKRTSVEGSAASGSPATESFPSSVTGRGRAARPPALNLQGRKSSAVDAALVRNFAFPTPSPRTPAVPSPLSMGSSATNRESPLPELPPLPDIHQRPLSIIAPLPELGLTKKVSHYRQRTAGTSTELVRSPSAPRPTSKGSHSRHNSTLSTDSARNSASYSLFPKRFSSLEKQVAPMTALPSPPLTAPERAMDSYFSTVDTSLMEELPIPLIVPVKPKGRYHERKPSNMSITTTFKFPTVSSEPERTPAVKAVHIASVFGTKNPASDLRSVSDPQMPSSAPFTGMKVITPTSARHSPQKSLPNISITTIAPGPPPSGPLPALPTGRPRSKSQGRPKKRNSPSGSKKASPQASTKTSPKSSSNNSSPNIPKSPRVGTTARHHHRKSSTLSNSGVRKSPPRPRSMARPATSAGEKAKSPEIFTSEFDTPLPIPGLPQYHVPLLPMPAKVSPLMGLNFSLPSPQYGAAFNLNLQPGSAKSHSSSNLQLPLSAGAHPHPPLSAAASSVYSQHLTPNTSVFPPNYLPPRDSSHRSSQRYSQVATRSQSQGRQHGRHTSDSSTMGASSFAVAPLRLRKQAQRRASITSVESGVLGMHGWNSQAPLNIAPLRYTKADKESDVARPKTADPKSGPQDWSQCQLQSPPVHPRLTRVDLEARNARVRNLTGIELALLAAE